MKRQKPDKIIYKNQKEIHNKIFNFIRSNLPKEVVEAYLFGSLVERKFGKYSEKFRSYEGSDIDVIIIIPTEKIPPHWKNLNISRGWWDLYRGGKIEIDGTIHKIDLMVVKEGKEKYAKNRIKEKNWKLEKIK